MSGRKPKLARRLVEPTWSSGPQYVETYGPEVADICALAGFAPDPEQELILDGTFAIGADGKSAAFEVDIIGPRQNFKTGSVKQMELGWLYVTQERLIVHSAHELSTTEEAFNELRELIENTPALARELDRSVGDSDTPGILGGNGRWSIHLVDREGRKRRLKYKARTNGGGRGLTGNKIVLDEGFALIPSHMGSLLPTLSAVPDPQVVTASSAGLLASAVLRDKRERGRAGSTPRQFYIEYGDPDPWAGCESPTCDHNKRAEGCALDDEDRWAAIMPALNRRVFPETVRAMRQAMPVEEFAREFMVWWEDPPLADGQVLDLGRWSTLVNEDATPPNRIAVALDVAPDRRKASIGVAGSGSGGATLLLTQTKPGTDWVVPDLLALMRSRDVAEVSLMPGSQAAVLLADLKAAGVEFESLTSSDLGKATAAFIESVNGDQRRLEHTGQAELDSAVIAARTRFVSENEVWDRKDRKSDISALVASSLAAYRWGLLGEPDYDVLDSIY